MINLHIFKSENAVIMLIWFITVLEMTLLLWSYCDDHPEAIKGIWHLFRRQPISNKTATQYSSPVLCLMGGIGNRHKRAQVLVMTNISDDKIMTNSDARLWCEKQYEDDTAN